MFQTHDVPVRLESGSIAQIKVTPMVTTNLLSSNPFEVKVRVQITGLDIVAKLDNGGVLRKVKDAVTAPLSFTPEMVDPSEIPLFDAISAKRGSGGAPTSVAPPKIRKARKIGSQYAGSQFDTRSMASGYESFHNPQSPGVYRSQTNGSEINGSSSYYNPQSSSLYPPPPPHLNTRASSHIPNHSKSPFHHSMAQMHHYNLQRNNMDNNSSISRPNSGAATVIQGANGYTSNFPSQIHPYQQSNQDFYLNSATNLETVKGVRTPSAAKLTPPINRMASLVIPPPPHHESIPFATTQMPFIHSTTPSIPFPMLPVASGEVRPAKNPLNINSNSYTNNYTNVNENNLQNDQANYHPVGIINRSSVVANSSGNHPQIQHAVSISDLPSVSILQNNNQTLTSYNNNNNNNKQSNDVALTSLLRPSFTPVANPAQNTSSALRSYHNEEQYQQRQQQPHSIIHKENNLNQIGHVNSSPPIQPTDLSSSGLQLQQQQQLNYLTTPPSFRDSEAHFEMKTSQVKGVTSINPQNFQKLNTNAGSLHNVNSSAVLYTDGITKNGSRIVIKP